MNKKQYIKPEQRVVMLQHKCHILNTSGNKMTVSHATTNVEIIYEGDDDEYTGDAR
jgi:hypothetical protein